MPSGAASAAAVRLLARHAGEWPASLGLLREYVRLPALEAHNLLPACVVGASVQVKRVQATPWDKLASEEQYAEELVDWEGGPPVPFEPGSAFVYVLEK